MRINAHEERLLPVELKVRMLMQQASMRMRASAMVGERISMLDDVIRVRALFAIIREKKAATRAASKEATEAAETTTKASHSRSSSCASSPATRLPPSDEEAVMFTRMAVSALKTVLFQLADEGAAESSKLDLSQLYDGLVSTDAIGLDASEGFPTLDVDSLMSLKHARYRKVVTSRHRFLVSYSVNSARGYCFLTNFFRRCRTAPVYETIRCCAPCTGYIYFASVGF